MDDVMMMAITYLTGPTLVGIGIDQLQDEVLGIVTDVLPVAFMEDDRVISAFPDEILEILASERGVTAEQGVSNDTHRPHVYGLSMALLAHHFRGSITKRASHGFEGFSLSVEHLCNTEVGQHKVGIGVSVEVEKVLRLKVYRFSVEKSEYDSSRKRTSVNNVVLVEKVDSKKDLLNGLSGILLSELALFTNTVEKLATRSELCNNVEFILENRQVSYSTFERRREEHWTEPGTEVGWSSKTKRGLFWVSG
jgi:hypothetical protein